MIQPEIKDTEEKLIEYPISNDETILEATIEAFETLDFDVFGQETTIERWVGDCAMTEINWDSEATCRLTLEVWGYPTVITSEALTIFDRPNGDDQARKQRSPP